MFNEAGGSVYSPWIRICFPGVSPLSLPSPARAKLFTLHPFVRAVVCPLSLGFYNFWIKVFSMKGAVGSFFVVVLRPIASPITPPFFRAEKIIFRVLNELMTHERFSGSKKR